MAKKTAKRVKHVPQRTCVGCRQTLAKRGLIRVVRTPEGLRVDPTGKLPGRGAYLHDRRVCWERGLKNTLAQALKVELTELDRDTLRAFMATLPETEPLEESTPTGEMLEIDRPGGETRKENEREVLAEKDTLAKREENAEREILAEQEESGTLGHVS